MSNYLLVTPDGRNEYRLISLSELEHEAVWNALLGELDETPWMMKAAAILLRFNMVYRNVTVYRFESDADYATLNTQLAQRPELIDDVIALGEVLYKVSDDN